MSDTKFPEGWDENRVRRVLAHYENQSEDEAANEDEIAVRPSETVMSIPHDLVAQVRVLIAKRER